MRVVAARPPKGSSDGSEQTPRKMQFEVKVVTPPERSLGPHMLPKNTHCGECRSAQDMFSHWRFST